MDPTDLTLAPRDRRDAASRTRRPAVVEHVDYPRSTSDGRTITPPADPGGRPAIGSQVARLAATGVIGGRASPLRPI